MSSVALRLSTRSSLFSATDPSFSLPPSSRSSSSGSVSRPGTPTPQAPSPAPSSSPPARCPPPFLSCLPVSFLRAASTVGAAAAASKVLGLMREMVLAAAFGVGPVMTAFRWAEVLPAFGVGPVMTAFSYASLIPTFCLSLLGGVNGPFHSAIASVLSKAAEKDTGKDTEKDTGKDSEKGGARSSLNAARMQQELLVLVSVLVALASIVAALLIFLCARPIIDLLAPGLSFPPAAVASDPSAVASFALTRHVAISQLQQMAPTIALAPLIGIGFGTLSARGEFAIPSLSPSLSSLSVLLGGIFRRPVLLVPSCRKFPQGPSHASPHTPLLLGQHPLPPSTHSSPHSIQIAFYFALCRWSPLASNLTKVPLMPPQRHSFFHHSPHSIQIAVYFALCRWSPVASPQREIIGGTCLAVSFTAGALLQWLIQLVAEIRSAPAPQQLAATPLPETTAAASAVQVVVTTEQPEDPTPAAPPAASPAAATAPSLPPAPPATAKTAAITAPAPAPSPPPSAAAAAAATAPHVHAPSWLPLTALFARHSEQLREVFGVLIPATVASGMLQIATFTDLYFASFLPGTAAALGYANLLVMAPLGILSTALLVPLLPAFARLAHPKDRPLLKDSLRRGLVMALAVTLPMTAVMLPLARPIVRIVFQRRSFDASATSLVSSLLSCYLLGSPCYLARDVLVRLFYSLADGTTPFLISTFAIAANAVLDFLFVSRWKFGPQGLVLATAAVNSASAVALLCLAHRRMGGLPLSLWWPSFSILFQSAAATAITVTVMHKLLSAALTTASHLLSLQPTWVWLLDAAALGTTAAAGFLVFCALVVTMRLPEAMPLWARVKSLLQKHGLLKLRTSAQF
ncbi:unnamed protein product [Closterium sp. NIES-65]|nr:unnamed protein product [Closterium sp. NIES-65]